MANELRQVWTKTYTFYDSGGNPVAPYTPVSLGLAASASAVGVSTGQCCVLPTANSDGTGGTQIIGVTDGWAYSGKQVKVIVAGVALCIANAAITERNWVYVVSATTRATNLAPFLNLPAIAPLLNPDITSSLTFNVALIDDLAITAKTTTASIVYYPVGVALEPAGAQYDIIPVQLDFARFTI